MSINDERDILMHSSWSSLRDLMKFAKENHIILPKTILDAYVNLEAALKMTGWELDK